VAQGNTSYDDELDMSKWPLATGDKWPLTKDELMGSEGHNVCITIDNPFMDQRLILDYADANHPK
jgi:hypothetical protein